MAVQVKVRAYQPHKPNEIREFTKEAFDYIKGDAIKPKWVLADDQPTAAPQEKKVQVAVPAVDRKPELRDKLKALVDADIDPAWNEARLHIEIVKATEAKKQKAEKEATEKEKEVIEEPVVVTEAVNDKPVKNTKKKAVASA